MFKRLAASAAIVGMLGFGGIVATSVDAPIASAGGCGGWNGFFLNFNWCAGGGGFYPGGFYPQNNCCQPPPPPPPCGCGNGYGDGYGDGYFGNQPGFG